MTYNGLALSGKMRSGKDSALKAISTIEPQAKRYAFADELKRWAAKMAGLPEDYYFDEENKKRDRAYLIALGAAGRAKDPLFWVNLTIRKIQSDGAVLPVITDLRYINEAKALREHGMYLVRINAEPRTIIARGGQLLDDPSETELDGWSDWDQVLQSEHGMPDELAMRILDGFQEACKPVMLD